MDEFELLVDLHKGANRQGPGGEAETEKAIALAGIDRDMPLKLQILAVALVPLR
ncbi:hypothetical protein [Alkalilimnicola ehrlichii]|uniref:hypothetical protein n=1 Tax=Alkalilimnicola ehrlichii TaxID=351052 RepID=UPI002162D6E9|nr:hypothetical protein [Alkalilimnicola ehrlichii]